MPEIAQAQSENASTRRQRRYGRLVPAWRWRTFPETLREMEEARAALGIGKTEFLERAVRAFLDELASQSLQK